MKKKNNHWIIGIGGKEQCYKIGDVTYFVSAHFDPPTRKDDTTLKERLSRSVSNDFIHLKIPDVSSTIADEYMSSTAGEEEI